MNDGTQRLETRLDRPVDDSYDHVLGPAGAQIILVEYGSYACPYCRAANEQIAAVRDEFGDRLRYVFRHRPLTDSDIARRAAELAEQAGDRFWDVHVELMTRSEELIEDDLAAVAERLDLASRDRQTAERSIREARARVHADEQSARASGVLFTPTFFINSRRYDGPWDAASLSDAMQRRLDHRGRTAATDFASWGPSAGFLLLFAVLIAVAITNSPLGPDFTAFWEKDLGFSFGAFDYRMSLLHWVNDGLLTVFFLVVGLEIKREFTVGRLSTRRSAALPVAGAIGGMAMPVLLYSAAMPQAPWSHGWGVPMATDTAFAIALIAMMGPRVPVELRVFLTAASIVDDIGAIAVVAGFYSSDLHLAYLTGAMLTTGGLAMLTHSRVYVLTPYVLLGILLWACIHASGLHASLAGVILAMAIPTRPPANLRALSLQAQTVIKADAKQRADTLRGGPSLTTLRMLDAIHDRIESPADRLLRRAGARSSYVILPLFALANGGVEISADVWSSHLSLMLAIMAGLVIGKPLGVVLASWLAVRAGLAVKPDAYSWRQLLGAGALAGIGFTMSLFIAGQAFPVPQDFAAAKIAVFVASILSAAIGVALLWGANRR